MPTELEIALEKQIAELKKSQAKLNESANEKQLTFFRNQLLKLGEHTDTQKERINKMTDISSLEYLIEERQNQIIEGEDKRKEADAEKKKKEKSEDDEKHMKSNKMVVNTSGRPTIKAPTGEILEAKPVRNVFNSAVPEAHFINPLEVPKYFNLFDLRARPNPLPPDKDHPYQRVIA